MVSGSSQGIYVQCMHGADELTSHIITDKKGDHSCVLLTVTSL